MAQMFRTRFARDIVTEFLPPVRTGKIQKAIILCDGMPSIPRKQSLSEFLSAKGYWVFYPRYRGAWESGGEFLARSPHLDILDVIGGLAQEFRELAFGRRLRIVRWWIGKFCRASRRKRLRIRVTRHIFARRSGMDIGCRIKIGRSSA